MAAVTQTLGTFDNGNASVSYTFDDQTLLVSTLTVVNNSGGAAHIGYVIAQADGTVVAQGTANAGTGTTTRDVSALNVHVVTTTKAGTTFFGLPFTIALSWG
jgi:hypothetical protein